MQSSPRKSNQLKIEIFNEFQQKLDNQTNQNNDETKLMSSKKSYKNTLAKTNKLTESMIKTIANADTLNTIEVLIMNRNLNCSLPMIKTISGLNNLMNLKEIDISHHDIEKIENLNNLKRLKIINLSHNRILKIENLTGLKYLEKLNLSYNLIQEIPQLLSKNFNLIELLLSHNGITKKDNLNNLKNLPKLKMLDLEGNPITNYSDYKAYALNTLKQIDILDKNIVDNMVRRFPSKLYNSQIKQSNQLPESNLMVSMINEPESINFTSRSKDEPKVFQNFTLNGDSLCAISNLNPETKRIVKVLNNNQIQDFNTEQVSIDKSTKHINKIKDFMVKIRCFLENIGQENKSTEGNQFSRTYGNQNSTSHWELDTSTRERAYSSPLKSGESQTPSTLKRQNHLASSRNSTTIKDSLEFPNNANLTINEEHLISSQSHNILINQLNSERAKIKGKIREIINSFKEIKGRAFEIFISYSEASEKIEAYLQKLSLNMLTIKSFQFDSIRQNFSVAWQQIHTEFLKIDNNQQNGTLVPQNTIIYVAISEYKNVSTLIQMKINRVREVLSKMQEYILEVDEETEVQMSYFSKLWKMQFKADMDENSVKVPNQSSLMPDIEEKDTNPRGLYSARSSSKNNNYRASRGFSNASDSLFSYNSQHCRRTTSIGANIKKDLSKATIKNSCELEDEQKSNVKSRSGECYSPLIKEPTVANVPSNNSSERISIPKSLDQNCSEGRSSLEKAKVSEFDTNQIIENHESIICFEDTANKKTKNINGITMSTQLQEKVIAESKEINKEGTNFQAASVSVLSNIPNINISAYSTKLTTDFASYIKSDQIGQSINSLKMITEKKEKCSNCESKEDTLRNNQSSTKLLIQENKRLLNKLEKLKDLYEDQIKSIIKNYDMQINALEEEKNENSRIFETLLGFNEKILENLNISQNKINYSIDMMQNDLRCSNLTSNPLKWIVDAQASTIEFLINEKKIAGEFINEKLLEIKTLIQQKFDRLFTSNQNQNLKIESLSIQFKDASPKASSLNSQPFSNNQVMECSNISYNTLQLDKNKQDANDINAYILRQINYDDKTSVENDIIASTNQIDCTNTPRAQTYTIYEDYINKLSFTKNESFTPLSKMLKGSSETESAIDNNLPKKNLMRTLLVNSDTKPNRYHELNKERSPINQNMRLSNILFARNIHSANQDTKSNLINQERPKKDSKDEDIHDYPKTPKSDNTQSGTFKFFSPGFNQKSQNNNQMIDDNTESNIQNIETNLNYNNESQMKVYHSQTPNTNSFNKPSISNSSSHHRSGSASITNLCESIAQEIIQQKPKTKAELSLMKMHKNFINYKKSIFGSKYFEKFQSNTSSSGITRQEDITRPCPTSEETMDHNNFINLTKSKFSAPIICMPLSKNIGNSQATTSSFEQTRIRHSSINYTDTSKVSKLEIDNKQDIENMVSVNLRNSIKEKRKLLASPTIAKYSDKFDMNSPYHPVFHLNLNDIPNPTFNSFRSLSISKK